MYFYYKINILRMLLDDRRSSFANTLDKFSIWINPVLVISNRVRYKSFCKMNMYLDSNIERIGIRGINVPTY